MGAFVILGLFVLVSEDSSWLQFGGPTRDFVAPDQGLLESWPEEGLEPLWELPIAGNYASLLVENDRMYSMFRSPEDREMLAAIDARNGSFLWGFEWDSVPHEAARLDFGKGPNSTPLVHGEWIVGIGFSGHLHCLLKDTGSLVWSRDLKVEFGAKDHMFGYSISPLRYDDSVIVAVGGEDSGVVAFDFESGDIVWESAPIDVSYASPFVIRLENEEQIVLMASTEVVGIDPLDGEILWRHPHQNLNKNNCWTPTWHEGLLYISSHSDGYSEVLRLTQVEGKTEVQAVWRHPRVRLFHSSCIRVDDYLYGSSGTSAPTIFVAVNIQTGEIAWRERGYNNATCTYADGRIYMLDEVGTLHLANVSPDGLDVISSFQPLSETAWTAPTIANGVLYVRDQSKVMAFDIREDASSGIAD